MYASGVYAHLITEHIELTWWEKEQSAQRLKQRASRLFEQIQEWPITCNVEEAVSVV